MKTIYEKAKLIWPDSIHELDKGTIEMFRDIFIKGTLFAQRWISVEDELPDEYSNITVLVKRKNKKSIYLAKYYKKRGGEWQGEFSYFNDVTHWRPIELK